MRCPLVTRDRLRQRKALRCKRDEISERGVVAIGGSGSEMSSIAIVTRIPGSSSAYSGSISSG